ncbi:hypothetical protein OIU77_013279 [Salix suchowensis]|uniref:Uncharacterized protein n=1 Tax=Salix suchowensis TaxID=1278906 RepID=A0ABQ8ZTM9_9ROSI|nr:hypothetical protein OIU77_013279 [Salix suchowensis]
MGGMHMLNKIYLINPRENEDIHLPPSTKAVKDILISPCGRFTLLASLGKKLSILSQLKGCVHQSSVCTLLEILLPLEGFMLLLLATVFQSLRVI